MLLYVIGGLVVVSFVMEVFLEYLNSTRRSPRLPDELKNIYDEDKYSKSVEYEKVKHRFSLAQGSFSLLLVLAMLFLGGFAVVDEFARGISDSPVIIALIFFGVIMFGADILQTPFDWYGTFVIEEKFGFNKSTLTVFLADKLKGWVLTAILGGGLLALITWFYYLAGEWFWIYALAVIMGFGIFMNMFYSTLIVPLFNKQTPLKEGELKDKIASLSKKTGFRLDDVYVIDGSKRSTKANAYFAGIGKKKRIVLFDTLMEDLSADNILAVLAHEIGHYKKKHTVVNMAVSFVTTAIALYLLSVMVTNPALSEALGADSPSFHMGLVAFGILYSPVSAVFGILNNWISRKNEYQADRFAAKHHSAEELADALKKLSVKNLSNLLPHPLYVAVHYSHPPLLNRLRALKNNDHENP